VSPLALPRRRPRVVALEVTEAAQPGAARAGDESGGTGSLARLQAALATRLAADGWYRPEARPFRAHVTVARVRAQSRIDARALQRLAPIEIAPFVADTVTLFRSRTRPGGAQYEPLARVRLTTS